MSGEGVPHLEERLSVLTNKNKNDFLMKCISEFKLKGEARC